MSKRRCVIRQTKECEACGCPDPVEQKECPYCGTMKCRMCDMGDDVECPACDQEAQP